MTFVAPYNLKRQLVLPVRTAALKTDNWQRAVRQRTCGHWRGSFPSKRACCWILKARHRNPPPLWRHLQLPSLSRWDYEPPPVSWYYVPCPPVSWYSAASPPVSCDSVSSILLPELPEFKCKAYESAAALEALAIAGLYVEVGLRNLAAT